MPKLITKAFEKIGLYSINCSVFTLADFVPSKASLTIAHIPKTFLNAFLPSDPIKLLDLETIYSLASKKDNSDPTFMIDNKLDNLGSNFLGIKDNPVDVDPIHLILGLMTALMQLESRMLYRIYSIILAVLAKSQMLSLNVSLLKKDYM
jgi:hypothetical protein